MKTLMLDNLGGIVPYECPFTSGGNSHFSLTKKKKKIVPIIEFAPFNITAPLYVTICVFIK